MAYRRYIVKLCIETEEETPLSAAQEGLYAAQKQADGTEWVFEVVDIETGELTRWRAKNVGPGTDWRPDR